MILRNDGDHQSGNIYYFIISFSPFHRSSLNSALRGRFHGRMKFESNQYLNIICIVHRNTSIGQPIRKIANFPTIPDVIVLKVTSSENSRLSLKTFKSILSSSDPMSCLRFPHVIISFHFILRYTPRFQLQNKNFLYSTKDDQIVLDGNRSAFK